MNMGAGAPAASSAVHRSRWSDPASWPDGKVPGAGDAVTIGRDTGSDQRDRTTAEAGAWAGMAIWACVS